MCSYLMKEAEDADCTPRTEVREEIEQAEREARNLMSSYLTGASQDDHRCFTALILPDEDLTPEELEEAKKKARESLNAVVAEEARPVSPFDQAKVRELEEKLQEKEQLYQETLAKLQRD